jgi:hypothetical protein
VDLAKETNRQPSIDADEHSTVNGRGAKKVVAIDGIGGGVGGAFNIPANDYFEVDYPTDSREIYTFYLGGSGGTLVGTLTINYTSNTKEDIANAAMVRP